MYMSPGEAFHDFTVDDKSTTVSSSGRIKRSFASSKTIKGALTSANPKEKEKYNQAQHPITHTIAQKGKPQAKAEDCLIYDGRRFYIQGVDNPGDLDLWTIYYVEERKS